MYVCVYVCVLVTSLLCPSSSSPLLLCPLHVKVDEVRAEYNKNVESMAEEIKQLELVSPGCAVLLYEWSSTTSVPVGVHSSPYLLCFISSPHPSSLPLSSPPHTQDCNEKQASLERALREKKAVVLELSKVGTTPNTALP